MLRVDGKYLIARSDAFTLDVVVVATGQVIPLPFSRDLELPAWKP